MPGPLDPSDQRLRQILAVAASVNGHPGKKRKAWAREHAGVDIDHRQFDHAIKPQHGPRPPIRPTFDIPADFFGLAVYLMRVDGRSLRYPDLVASVEGLAGVVMVVELEDQLDLLVFCLVEDDQEADRLREAIRARVPTDRGVSKQRVARMTRQPEIRTWTALAKRRARRMEDGVRLPPGL